MDPQHDHDRHQRPYDYLEERVRPGAAAQREEHRQRRRRHAHQLTAGQAEEPANPVPVVLRVAGHGQTGTIGTRAATTAAPAAAPSDPAPSATARVRPDVRAVPVSGTAERSRPVDDGFATESNTGSEAGAGGSP